MTTADEWSLDMAIRTILKLSGLRKSEQYQVLTNWYKTAGEPNEELTGFYKKVHTNMKEDIATLETSAVPFDKLRGQYRLNMANWLSLESIYLSSLFMRLRIYLDTRVLATESDFTFWCFNFSITPAEVTATHIEGISFDAWRKRILQKRQSLLSC